MLASFAAFALVISGHGSQLLQRLETGYADLRTSLMSDRTPVEHNDITLVSVGDNVSATRATFGQRVEVDRGQLARLIEAIDDSAPRAIGLDVPIGEAGDPIKDQQLQRALREAKARVVIGLRQRGAGSLVERRGYTDRFISDTGRPAGHISTFYEGDRAMRTDSGAQTRSNVPDSFALLMARAIRPELQRNVGPIAWLQRIEPGGIVSRVLNVGAVSPFRVLYASELLDSTKPMPTRQLAGKLVIVTTGLAEVERHRTPLTIWTGETMAPVQVQAQAIAQLLDGRTFDDLQPSNTRIALFALACAAGFVGWVRGPGWGFGSAGIALLVLVAIDVIIYAWSGSMLPMVMIVLLWMLGQAAGRSLKGILAWEERHGQPWPVEGAKEGEQRQQETDASRTLPLA